MARLTFQEEAFKDVQPQIVAIMDDHWHEVTLRPKTDLDPDWTRFFTIDAAGLLTVVTARDNDKLVGYVVLIMVPLLHYRSVQCAHDDAFFLKKDYRKGLTGSKLIQAAEDIMRAKGANRIAFHEKPSVPTGRLFKWRGYDVEEIIWMKEL
jgi:GNAT superfamily N-acetyltransferase